MTIPSPCVVPGTRTRKYLPLSRAAGAELVREFVEAIVDATNARKPTSRSRSRQHRHVARAEVLAFRSPSLPVAEITRIVSLDRDQQWKINDLKSAAVDTSPSSVSHRT